MNSDDSKGSHMRGRRGADVEWNKETCNVGTKCTWNSSNGYDRFQNFILQPYGHKQGSILRVSLYHFNLAEE